jgi:hypothetical protein
VNDLFDLRTDGQPQAKHWNLSRRTGPAKL